MTYTDYVQIAGELYNITNTEDCCSQMISIRTGNGIVNFIVDPETVVVDSQRLRQGMYVAAFYDKTLPVPMIFPPQYRAKLITVLGMDEQVSMNFYDRNFLAADKSLQLNISIYTDIVTLNGQDFNCSPVNRVLLVYYRTTSRSIPPQTTPSRIIVMC